jgi:acetyl esterase/lipase
MPSWQNHLLRLAQHGFRAFNGRSNNLDVAQERRNAALAEKLFKPSPALRYSAVTANGMPAEWLAPLSLPTEHVVMYVHGGGFYSGTIVGARPVAGSVALASQARVLTVGYRLTPEHPFPAALDDVQAAYEWLLTNGTAPEKITLVGDSAGGNLVLALLVKLRDQNRPLPHRAVCLSPATDLSMAGETWTQNAQRDLLIEPHKIRAAITLYLNGTDPTHPWASPLWADLHGLPPVLILVGGAERLLSDSTRWAEKAQAAGVAATLEVWGGMQHGWHILHTFLPEGRQALARIAAFIQAD